MIVCVGFWNPPQPPPRVGQVIQRYYVQYLAGYDAVALAQMIQTTSVTSEEDNIILSSICTQISQLSLDNVEVIH